MSKKNDSGKLSFRDIIFKIYPDFNSPLDENNNLKPEFLEYIRKQKPIFNISKRGVI